jgi:hypothetical protein
MDNETKRNSDLLESGVDEYAEVEVSDEAPKKRGRPAKKDEDSEE